MTTAPLVSVIVPAFNAQDYIQETLDSILAQTYPNLEVIVVDDGSTDHTAQIVESYGSRVFYIIQDNSGGASVPRNTGIKKSTGEFLCFIDADDIMVPNRIEHQVDFMNKHPDVGLVFSDYRNFNNDGIFSKTHFQTCPNLWTCLKNSDQLVLDQACLYLAKENFGISGSFMIARNLLDFVPGFEPSLKACEDFYFYFQLARHTSVGLINEVGMLRRLHGSNMSDNLTKMLSAGILSRTLLRDSEQNPEVRKCLNRYLVDRRDSMARFHADHGHFLQALRCSWQTFHGPFTWPEAMRVIRSMSRTVLMAVKLHRPETG